MIRLHDFELSGSCYKVRLLLNILKVSCERIPVDFIRKEHKTEQFLKPQPARRDPGHGRRRGPAARRAGDPGLYRSHL